MSAVHKLLGFMLLATTVLPPAACEPINTEVTWPQCNRPGTKVIRRGDHDDIARVLNLVQCGVSHIHPSDLEGLPNLKRLVLYSNHLQHLDPKVFRSTPELYYLRVGNNTLEEIPVFGAHSVLPKLEYLDLSDNRITKLNDSKTFSSTKQLRTLNLKRNRIEYIHPDMFSGLTNLRTLHMEENKLTYIAGKTFAVKSLRDVYLSDNLIAHVDSSAFLSCQLNTLAVNDNKLRTLPENFFACTENKLIFCGHSNPWECTYLPNISERVLNCPDGWEVECK